MRDILRCDNCRVVVRVAEAANWWTISRLYPYAQFGKEEEAYDFCSEKCLNEWIDKRRAQAARR